MIKPLLAVLLVPLFLFTLSGEAKAGTKDSNRKIASEALYCSSVFYLLTSLGSADKDLGNLYMNVAITMADIYRYNQKKN